MGCIQPKSNRFFNLIKLETLTLATNAKSRTIKSNDITELKKGKPSYIKLNSNISESFIPNSKTEHIKESNINSSDNKHTQISNSPQTISFLHLNKQDEQRMIFNVLSNHFLFKELTPLLM